MPTTTTMMMILIRLRLRRLRSEKTYGPAQELTLSENNI